jgi:glycosyltransferase involved in cell wall biosynthesis
MNMENRKIKIGLNASFARKPNTGIGQVTLNVLRELAVYPDIDFVLYLEEDIPTALLALPKNFSKRIFLPRWKRDDLIRKIWWEKFMLPRAVKDDGCDVLLSMYQCPTRIEPYEEVMHIMIVHDIIPKFFSQYLDNIRKKIYWKLTEKAIRKADKIIAVSKHTEKDLIEQLKIHGKKITVSYIDVDAIYKQPVAAKNNVRVLKKYKLKPGYILAGGGYETRKNVEGVVRAYKFLLERNAKLHFIAELPKLVIYGKIMSEKLSLALDIQKLLRELDLTTHAKLLDLVPQKDLPAVFFNASVFVYPSYYEGFGMPVLEAMNLGKPVITSKTSSLPEVGGDGVLYCDPKDPHDIAMVMKNVLENHDLRQTLSIRAKLQAQKFSWQKFCEKIIEISKQINYND